MATVRAYLYDWGTDPVGSVGVVVRTENDYEGPQEGWRSYDVAVFSPWPSSLGLGVPFAVRVEGGNGRRWRSPLEVFHTRVKGWPESEDLVWVVLGGLSEVATLVSGRDMTLDPNIETLSVRGLVTANVHRPSESGSTPLDALNTPTTAVDDLKAHRHRPAKALDVRAALDTPSYTRTTGGPVAISKGICRFFRWD